LDVTFGADKRERRKCGKAIYFTVFENLLGCMFMISASGEMDSQKGCLRE